MDALSSIFTWLSDHEAGISAVVGIMVLAGALFAGLRWLLLRGTAGAPEKLLARPGRRVFLIAAVAAALVALVGVAAWLISPDRPATEIASEEQARIGLLTEPTIAVLPFDNLSGDPEQEYFADGITEEIITGLTRWRELSVVGRNSTFQYKGKAVDVKQVGRELGARYVLEGSVRKGTDTIRVTAQLLDAATGTHLWADTYERDLTVADLFGVQDEITEQIIATIAGEYGVISRAGFEETTGKRPDSLDAYDCLLRARWFWATNCSPEEHLQVRDCLERAVRLNPDIAEAWATLSYVYLDEERKAFNPRANSLDRGLEAARRAVDLDPRSGEAHQALAMAHLHRHELDLFFIEADRSLALNPNDPDALAELGEAMIYMGEQGRGLPLVKKAFALDPAPPGWFHFPLFEHHYQRGEYQEALSHAQRINMPEFFSNHLALVFAYSALGRLDEARASVAELRKVYPGFTIATAVQEMRSYNAPDEIIERKTEALRRAGLPE
jgi:TolB-like protein/Tfp pilus assembly protein PilF